MAQYLKRLLGIVHTEQRGSTIEIGGVGVNALSRDIKDKWGTSKIVSNIFTDLGSRHVAFNEFFALEVHYMLQQLKGTKTKWSSGSTIESALLELQRNTWLSNLEKDVSSSLDRSKLGMFHKSPLPHQDRFFGVYDNAKTKLGLNGYLLSAAAGSGKTLTNLMLAEMRHADHIVVVSPNNAVYRVWVKTVREEYKKPQTYWVAGENKPYNRERVLITHYEGLDKLMSVIGRVNGKVVVILDECHNFNEISAQRTQTFIALCKRTKSEDILWSSGTPIKALGGESIPLLRTIDPKFTPDVENAFKAIFGINARRALDILRNRMGMISYRVEKEDAMTVEVGSDDVVKVTIPNGKDYTLESVRQQMKDFIAERTKYYEENLRKYEDIYESCLYKFESAGLSPEVRAEYKAYRAAIEEIRDGYDARDERSRELGQMANKFEKDRIMPALNNADRKAFHSARSVIKYVQLKVMGEALGTVLGRARAQVHVDMIEHVDFEQIMSKAEKKTVIFTSYVAVVKALDKLLRSKNMKPMLVYGDTNKALTENVGAFETDPNVNPLVATYKSLSTAVPLIMADQTIFIDQPFRDHERVQARARTERIGQDRPVKYVSLLLDTGKEPNISTRSKDILEWSREQVSMIMGTESSSGLDGYIASLESLNRASLVVSLESNLRDRWDEVISVVSQESYREGPDSTFSSDGKEYQLDKLFEITDNRMTRDLKVSDLKWVLKYDKPKPDRKKSVVDSKAPIMVLYDENAKDPEQRWLVVDGLHRLSNAVDSSRTVIKGKLIWPSDMAKALIK